MRLPGTGVRFDGQAALFSAPPQLGEHTREVLAEAGFAAAEIDRLLSGGAARQYERRQV